MRLLACLTLAVILSVPVLALPTQIPATATPTLTGDAAHPAATQGWVSTQLYFGLGRYQPAPVKPAPPAPNAHATPARKGVTEDQWLAFLDHEVTPRFPYGLSVQDIYGQWQGRQQSQPVRLRSKVLIIVYPNTPENQAAIEAIRTAWKRITGDQSVLRVTTPAEVSF
jgi:hypothetical protein